MWLELRLRISIEFLPRGVKVKGKDSPKKFEMVPLHICHQEHEKGFTKAL
jgi:hypothetical protein